MGGERAAARTTGGGRGGTLVSRPETRVVYFAQGLDFREADTMRRGSEAYPLFELFRVLTEPRTAATNALLRDPFHGLAATVRWAPITWGSVGRDEWRYHSAAQDVDYVVRRIVTRTAFRDALREDGAIVVYAGHARYGRGPCFGPEGSPRGDDWETSANDDTSIFRMGYPFIATDKDEIAEHGYTPALAGPGTTLREEDCDPDLRPYVRRVRTRRLADLQPPLTHYTQNPEVLTYRAYDEGSVKDHVVHVAGWRNTAAQPRGMELGAITMTCRMFCHFGCSTYRHNYRVVRRLYGWQRTETDRFAYWTTAADYPPREALIWLYHMLTYDQPSGGLPWGPWLDYVKDRTNRDLRTSGWSHRII